MLKPALLLCSLFTSFTTLTNIALPSSLMSSMCPTAPSPDHHQPEPVSSPYASLVIPSEIPLAQAIDEYTQSKGENTYELIARSTNGSIVIQIRNADDDRIAIGGFFTPTEKLERFIDELQEAIWEETVRVGRGDEAREAGSDLEGLRAWRYDPEKEEDMRAEWARRREEMMRKEEEEEQKREKRDGD